MTNPAELLFSALGFTRGDRLAGSFATFFRRHGCGRFPGAGFALGRGHGCGRFLAAFAPLHPEELDDFRREFLSRHVIILAPLKILHKKCLIF
jgi:hypothetical protein